MADGPSEQALAIVDALQAAGVLEDRASLAGSERQALALSAAVVNALSAAGALQTQGTLAAPPPPPPPELEPGAFKSIVVQSLAKRLAANNTVTLELLSYESPQVRYTAELSHEAAEVFLPEVHRLQSVTRPIAVGATLMITEKVTATSYRCELRKLDASSGH